jgi:hypothetical protein
MLPQWLSWRSGPWLHKSPIPIKQQAHLLDKFNSIRYKLPIRRSEKWPAKQNKFILS